MDYSLRRQKLLETLQEKGIGNIFIQNLENIYYFSGFNAAVATRPFGLLLTPYKNVLFVPAVAADSAIKEARDIDISVYYEHPEGAEFGLSLYANMKSVMSCGLSGKVIGVESGRMSLNDHHVLLNMGYMTGDIDRDILQMRSVKEPEELSAIRIAAEYVDYMNLKTMKAFRSGISELELDQAGSFAIYQKIAKELPQASVSIFTFTTSGPERTAVIHTNSTMRQLRESDGVILCRQLGINAYRGQGDRTCFLGKPTLEQAKYHGIVMEAHSAALEIIRPGSTAANVDKVIRDVFARYGVEKYFITRSGSGIGLTVAELPMIRFDSKDIIEANMAIVIQPGLYIPGIGGFRCSDTLIVNDSGIEILTKNSRSAEELTC